MNSDPLLLRDKLLSVVKGRLTLQELESIGVTTTTRQLEDGIEIRSLGFVSIKPSIHDIAEGLLQQSPGEELREWATFVLVSDCIDFDGLEENSQWDGLLSALWDASFSGRVEGSVIPILKSLVSQVA